MTKLKQWMLTLKFMTEERYSIFMYLVMGGITTAINIITFWFCFSVLGVNYSIATVIAWIFSVLFAYVSNKLYVFESTNMSFRTLVREISSFITFRLLSLLMDLLVMYICVSVISMNAIVAKVLANIVVLIINYIFSKWFIFRRR